MGLAALRFLVVHLSDGFSVPRRSARILVVMTSNVPYIIVTAVVGLGAIWYARKQWNLKTKENADKELWSAKHAEARSLVLQTDKQPTFKTGGKYGYDHVFPDPVLRSQIETWIVQRDLTGLRPCLKPLDLEPEKLLLPTIQKAIQQTIDTVEQFKREHPEDSALLGF